jgi:hypothetical protein
MLTTSIPLSPAWVRASTVGWSRKNPESWPARMLTSSTPGATPPTPRPLSAAPIVPATWVPWLSSSTSAGSLHDGTSHGPSSMPGSGLSTVKFRLSSRLRFGAMSGWLPSTPVSMMPTRTSWVPGRRAYEPPGVAPIMAMSHCRPESWSPPGGGPPPAGAARADGSCSTSRQAGLPRACAGVRPIAVFAAAPTTAALARARRANPARLDRTVATPTARLRRTMRPPAVLTAWRACAALVPCARTTTNSRARSVCAAGAAWASARPATPARTDAHSTCLRMLPPVS